MTLCLLLSLSSCASWQPPTPPKVEPRSKIPRALVLITPAPAWRGTTNGDLLGWTIELRSALSQCNADKAAIESWDNR